MAQVLLNGVRKSFGALEIIKGVDLKVEDREFVVFVGPSGCGKSTLLRLIAGLEDLSGGTIQIDAETVNDLPPSERGIAMVFQSYALYPHMSVYENMAFGLRLAKTEKRELDRKVQDAAKILQLEQLLQRKPKELSGGQRQRVAIGRAIVRNPKVFLFDEPLSNLDAALRVQMRIEIARLHQDLNATMIYVTHDQVEAMTLADKIVVLNAGQVEQVGSPLELYHKPRNMFVAGFIGSPKMNFLPGTIEGVEGGQARVRLPSGSTVLVPVETAPAAGSRVTVGIRPEHMAWPGGAPEGVATLPGEVFVVEHLGGETYVYLRTDGGTITARVEGDKIVKPGDRVPVGLPAGACHVFTEGGTAIRRHAA
jgi:multiple sugar transport system ATP-binding protein